MTRLKAIDPEAAQGKAKSLLDAVKAKLKMTPNMMRTMAASPAVLEGYLNFSAALSSGTLSAQVREQIALAVGEANRCGYCVSAHSLLGKMAGLDDAKIQAGRRGTSDDSKVQAALDFARAIVKARGEVSDTDVEHVRKAGYNDGEIGEIVANVCLNLFTNYFNHVAKTEIDFPKVALLS